MLSPDQLRQRENKVTASFLPALMAGDSERILNEWRRLCGDPAYVEPDFSANWPVNFGTFIESHALDWHQKKTGRVLERRGEVVTHPTRPYVCCTLDAYRPDDAWVLDVKALGAFRKLDDACAYYAPQMIVQRECVEGNGAALLIVHGGAEPSEYPIETPTNYVSAVWERVDWFWSCVESLTVPVALAPIAAPVAAVKEYDFSQRNEWCIESSVWLDNHPAAKRFSSAEKNLKSMIPADAARCLGGGIVVKRDKAGRLSISATR